MANKAQCSLVAHKIRSALQYHLPEVQRDGANRIYEVIADNVKDFTNLEISFIIDTMNALEEDEITKQEALDKLVEWKVIPEKMCKGCQKPITQCKSC